MSLPKLELHAVVLAAGASRRFGRVKQLAVFGGQALLERAIARTRPAAHRTWVVLGANAAQLAPLAVNSRTSVITNPGWSEGMASSIRAGVDCLPRSCDGVMFVLCDQPLIEQEDLQRLGLAWRNAPESIVAACHDTTLGAPAVFPRRWFGALRQLSGDTGARALIAQHAAEVIAVTMPNAAFDVDTPEDLAALGNAASSAGAAH